MNPSRHDSNLTACRGEKVSKSSLYRKRFASALQSVRKYQKFGEWEIKRPLEFLFFIYILNCLLKGDNV